MTTTERLLKQRRIVSDVFLAIEKELINKAEELSSVTEKSNAYFAFKLLDKIFVINAVYLTGSIEFRTKRVYKSVVTVLDEKSKPMHEVEILISGVGFNNVTMFDHGNEFHPELEGIASNYVAKFIAHSDNYLD